VKGEGWRVPNRARVRGPVGGTEWKIQFFWEVKRDGGREAASRLGQKK